MVQSSDSVCEEIETEKDGDFLSDIGMGTIHLRSVSYRSSEGKPNTCSLRAVTAPHHLSISNHTTAGSEIY